MISATTLCKELLNVNGLVVDDTDFFANKYGELCILIKVHLRKGLQWKCPVCGKRYTRIYDDPYENKRWRALDFGGILVYIEAYLPRISPCCMIIFMNASMTAGSFHADETPVKVMRIDDQKIKNGKKTYMWVYRSRGVNSPPIILFEWQPSRRSDHPREFLKGFSGTVVTDGYQVYHLIEREREDLKVSGCWIHCRRPFAEFIKSITPEAAKGSIAQEAYLMITELLHLDNEFDDLSSEDRLKQRQLILQDKVDAYFEWVNLKYAQVTHNSVIGKALAYSINQEKYLRMFLTDGDIPMDNNAAYSYIRITCRTSYTPLHSWSEEFCLYRVGPRSKSQCNAIQHCGNSESQSPEHLQVP